MNSGIKVIAPASVSNLACGFDILGMALDIPCDEIIGRWSDIPGVRINQITGKKQGIPVDPELNTATVAARALLRHLGEQRRGIEFRIHKHLPACSGLGNSGSSAAAAVVLVNEMLNRPFERRDLVPFAIEGELLASITPVGDNVIPALIGGLVLIRDIDSFDFHRIFMPPGLFVSIILPDIQITTKAGRSILKPEVPLDLMIKQSANLGGFITGMHNGDFDLIRRSMVDHVIEPQRKHLIPHFDEVKTTAMDYGAIGCSLSGSGPAMFALCQEKTQAEAIASAWKKIYSTHRMNASAWNVGIDHEGVVVK